MLRTGLAPSLTIVLISTISLDVLAEAPPSGTASFPLVSETPRSAPPLSQPAQPAAVPAPLPPPPQTEPAPMPTRAPSAERASSATSAPTANAWELGPMLPAPAPSGGDRGGERPSKHERDPSDDWMLSIEGATHAPLDVGLMVGFETPVGLRLSGGYGWVLPAYLGLTSGMIGSSAGADAQTTALIQNGFQGGHAWRIQGGIRPFSKLGLYLDAGYSRVSLSGSVDASMVGGVPGLSSSAGYSVDSTLDMWLVELGYQAHVGQHVVLALGLGVMGTFKANTQVTPSGGLPALPASVSSNVDHQIEQHGYLPTLTARFGFDLI